METESILVEIPKSQDVSVIKVVKEPKTTKITQVAIAKQSLPELLMIEDYSYNANTDHSQTKMHRSPLGLV